MDHLAPPVGADDAPDLAPPANGAAGLAAGAVPAGGPLPAAADVCTDGAAPAAGDAPAAGAAPADGPVPAADPAACLVRPAAEEAEEAWPVLSAAARALAGAPVWRLADEDLVDRVREFEVVRARLEAHRLTVLRELDDRGWAARVGAASTQAWLAQAVRCDPRAAAADVRAARALDPDGDAPPEPGLPVMTGPARSDDDPPLASTGRALAAGVLSRAHADAVLASVRAIPSHPDPEVRADVVERAERFLLQQCALFDPATVRRLGREVVHGLDPSDTLAGELAAAARDELWLTTTATGRVRIREPPRVQWRLGCAASRGSRAVF